MKSVTTQESCLNGVEFLAVSHTFMVVTCLPSNVAASVKQDKIRCRRPRRCSTTGPLITAFLSAKQMQLLAKEFEQCGFAGRYLLSTDVD